MRAIPTGHRRKPVKPKASCPTCLPIAPSTTRVTGICSTAPCSSTTRPATRSVVLPGRPLTRKQLDWRKHRVAYAAPAEICGACALKSRCTPSPQRFVHLHLHEAALQRMHQRATSAAMRLRRSTVEHPFATLKYQLFGYPRFLLRGVAGAQTRSVWGPWPTTSTHDQLPRRPKTRHCPLQLNPQLLRYLHGK